MQIPRRPGPWWWWVMVPILLYLALVVGLVGYLWQKYDGLTLAEVEPRDDMSDYRPQPVSLEPGRYGPERPLQVNTFKGRALRTTINAFGSRNPLPVDPGHAGNVLLLGDSFFFGYGLDDQQTISAHLSSHQLFKPYIQQIRKLARKQGAGFYEVKELLPREADRALLSDGHPAGPLNQALAQKLLPLLRSGARAPDSATR